MQTSLKMTTWVTLFLSKLEIFKDLTKENAQVSEDKVSL